MCGKVERSDWWFARSTLAIALSICCAITISGYSRRPVERTDVVSREPPKFEALTTVAPMAVRPRIEGQGECAPIYATGGKGMCVNNSPCRGFAVRADNGEAVCTCYGRDGGCAVGQKCDAEKLACVPEREAPFGRAESD
jgi:hypothetical protein